MATTSDSNFIAENFEKVLNIENNDDNNLEYGLPLQEVYKLGLSFYKGKTLHPSYTPITTIISNNNHKFNHSLFFICDSEKEGKAVHFSYEDKLQLVAFSQQVLHGPLSEAIHKLPPLGALDVVGRDRRVAWQKLGKLSVDQARAGFIELLSRRCPLFSAYIEAHRREKKEQERLA